MCRTNHKAAGQFLRELREKAGFSIRRHFVASSKSRFTYDHVADLENGRCEPSALDLIIYRDLTECTADELLKIPVC